MTEAGHAQLPGVLVERRSVREFRPEPVARELLEALLEAASWAPSAGNRQDWFFSVVESAELKAATAQAVRREWQRICDEHGHLGVVEDLARYSAGFADFEKAPVVIAVSAARTGALQEELLGASALATSGSFASAAMAAQNLMLAAHALGLGTCCMTGALAAGAELGRLLGLGRRREIVCLLAVGYPAARPDPPARKSVGEIARFHS
jgi:nitroreductase